MLKQEKLSNINLGLDLRFSGLNYFRFINQSMYLSYPRISSKSDAKLY